MRGAGLLVLGAGALGLLLLTSKRKRPAIVPPFEGEPARPSGPGFEPEMIEGEADLETLLNNAQAITGIQGLAAFLMAVARRESRFNPNARNPRTGVDKGDGPPARRLFLSDINQARYANNNWINDPDAWSYSGGLFGFMPATALATADNEAVLADPESVFNPLLSVAYAVDFLFRLHRGYDAHTWDEMRVGWAAPSLIDNPESDRYQETVGRLHTDFAALGIPASFGQERVDMSGYLGFRNLVDGLMAGRVA